MQRSDVARSNVLPDVVLAFLHRVLPQGGALPPKEWRIRHRALTAFLWLNAAVLPLYGLIAGGDQGLHDVAHALVLLPFAALASSSRFGPKLRSVFTSVAC
jgi:hypothetical protein